MATAFPPFDGSAPKTQEFPDAPEMGIDPSKRYTATMSTSMGDIVIALDAVKAPKTVNNFVFLALHHYYDGVIFHRIINGFMCQGGDPTGTGRGGPGYRFEDELPKPREYQIGSVAMANAGPNTNGSQFFIIIGPVGRRPAAAVQPVRPGREGPRHRRRRCSSVADRRRRQARRPTSSSTRSPSPSPTTDVATGATRWRVGRVSPTPRRAASRSARRASPTRARPAGSTAVTCGACVDRMGLIQIDSVNVLVRSQELPLFARLGPHPRTLIADASRDGELFEYWVHEACHVPVAQHPYLRWTMNTRAPVEGASPELRHRRPEFIDEVRIRIRDEGPLVAGDLEPAGRPEGHLVGLGRRQDRARAPVLHRRGHGASAGRTTSPASTTSPSG